MKANPTPEQLEIIKEFISFENRPSFKLYSKFQTRMKKTTGKRPTKIINTHPGFESGEVKLSKEFNIGDIPSGFGLYCMYDSGCNYKIMNAGKMIITYLYNYWVDNKIDREIYLTRILTLN